MIVCGDRDWTNKALIREVMIDYDPDVLIEGEARGADKLSRIVAEEDLGLSVEDETIIAMPADWDRHHKAAGPIRNKAMLLRLFEYEDLDYIIVVVGFHNDIEKSTGTKNMRDISIKAGVDVEIITEEDENEDV